MKNYIGQMRVGIRVDITLWDAIKMRIAGIGQLIKKTSTKVTIDDLIEKSRS
jgi:hypothetical protein